MLLLLCYINPVLLTNKENDRTHIGMVLLLPFSEFPLLQVSVHITLSVGLGRDRLQLLRH